MSEKVKREGVIMDLNVDGFVFNFRKKCNMNCKYCFIPFIDQSSGDISLWKEIIDYLVKFNPRMITIGGGDPFNNNEILDLIRYIKERGISVHVDTNGVALKPDMYKSIICNVDILGLPLDGDEKSHDKLRGLQGHFNKVISHLNNLSSLGYRVKINTVITKQNYLSLNKLAMVLNQYPLLYWSLHEYWNYDSINSSKYYLEHEEACKIIEELKLSSQHNIKFGSVTNRKNEHVFISSLGNFYITDPHDMHKYIELGNFKNDGIKEILQKRINASAISQRCNRKSQ